jgi:hypothetical protein
VASLVIPFTNENQPTASHQRFKSPGSRPERNAEHSRSLPNAQPYRAPVDLPQLADVLKQGLDLATGKAFLVLSKSGTLFIFTLLCLAGRTGAWCVDLREPGERLLHRPGEPGCLAPPFIPLWPIGRGSTGNNFDSVGVATAPEPKNTTQLEIGFRLRIVVKHLAKQ